jgi:hypothetical protein
VIWVCFGVFYVQCCFVHTEHSVLGLKVMRLQMDNPILKYLVVTKVYVYKFMLI